MCIYIFFSSLLVFYFFFFAIHNSSCFLFLSRRVYLLLFSPSRLWLLRFVIILVHLLDFCCRSSFVFRFFYYFSLFPPFLLFVFLLSAVALHCIVLVRLFPHSSSSFIILRFLSHISVVMFPCISCYLLTLGCGSVFLVVAFLVFHTRY